MYPCINGATTMPYTLQDDIRSAAAAGFPAVELWAGKLDAYFAHHSTADLAASLRAAGLRVAALCPYTLRMFGDWRAGLDPVRRGLEVAAAVACPLLLVCPDAPPDGMDPQDAVSVAGEHARAYAEAAADAGVALAIEPLGGHPFVPGPRQAMSLIAAAGHPALTLMMDTFHYHKSRVLESDIAAVPPELWRIVHVNDVPAGDPSALSDADRLYPGEGALPLTATLMRLQAAGYRGAVSVEVFRRDYWRQPVDVIAQQAMTAITAVLTGMEAPR